MPRRIPFVNTGRSLAVKHSLFCTNNIWHRPIRANHGGGSGTVQLALVVRRPTSVRADVLPQLN